MLLLYNKNSGEGNMSDQYREFYHQSSEKILNVPWRVHPNKAQLSEPNIVRFFFASVSYVQILEHSLVHLRLRFQNKRNRYSKNNNYLL